MVSISLYLYEDIVTLDFTVTVEIQAAFCHPVIRRLSIFVSQIIVVFILETHYPSGPNFASINCSSGSGSSGTTRIMRLDEP